MLPKYHLILGFLFSLILYSIFPFIYLSGFFIIFFSSFLIDVDHYIYYIFKKKDLNLKKAYKYFFEKRKKFISSTKFVNERPNPAMYFLHGVEVLLILFIFGIFISKYFLFIFIGFSFHLFLDILEQIYYGFKIAKISLVYDFIKLKD
ncbi:MAG: hypothetical protein AABY06_01105 [Nanoarchaeota archaeon]